MSDDDITKADVPGLWDWENTGVMIAGGMFLVVVAILSPLWLPFIIADHLGWIDIDSWGDDETAAE